MTMRVNIKITRDESAAMLRIKDVMQDLLQPLARAWNQGSQEVVGRAVKNRFTGRGPFPVSQNRLGIRTNRLRKSLRATLVQINESSGEMSSSMGSNVSYFAPHEFGLRGRVQVAGHTRRAVAENRRTPSGRLTKATTGKLKQNFKRGRAGYSYVRPHTRNVNTPARRPLGTEINNTQTMLTFSQKIRSVLNLILRKP